MDPKIIIIIAVAYVYAFFELFMNLRQRRNSRGANMGDKNSLWVLYGLITIGYFLSFSIGMTKIGRIHPWNTFFAIGMGVFAAGLVIRVLSIATLKRFFSYSVATVEKHKLIDTGLYRYIRHPGYLGQLIIFLGISMSISNGLSILAMMIPVAIGYAYRINVEERFMAEQFGDEYLDYQRRTKKLLPFVF
jgi:protein-S-isoprenylcysteine O-methyltransferase Ste14